MVSNEREQQQTTFFGLSTDTKPVAENGSCYIEMDSSKIYFYDAEGAQWTEWEA